MPRNGSGTFTVDLDLAPNTTAKASEVNSIAKDLGDEITNSVAADGQSVMTGPLKLANGTAANPTLTFGSDPDTGFYRIGPNQVGLAQGGVGTPLNAFFPAGIIQDFAGSVAPTGYLLCYGQAISRTTYAMLFAAIGIAYGSGDGSTTFNLPDCRGRVSAGLDNMGGSAASRLTNTQVSPNGNTLGAVGGVQTVTLDISQIPAHPHGVTDPGHNHGVIDPGHVHALNRSVGSGSGYAPIGAQNPGAGGDTTYPAGTDITIQPGATGISIQPNGGGNAHGNVQPTILFNKIISTGALS